ncbi:hypothetical protein DS2_13634 [Catenovulum agarivorans DS-2]|uniref:ASPIC/UnbV domain-containing protein n=1 Tax=Catenovulum agarivorans DS-2 TaxID=1328313 RepID=W7QB60_9ALTE|nr:CRTAC1 family protein [Catenovulum agarivorans]EWH09206.1 hypothetical protein DS2_13634 [Catenovulum agarivorans DS-2]
MVKTFKINTVLLALSSSLTLGLASCAQSDTDSLNISKPDNTTLFKKTHGVIPFGDVLNRKWGSAVIADLDQDGWQDVVTTQHGANALIYWNEQGKFTQPSTLVKGDTHGLGVADYDGDGNMNIVVAQGGGDGGNPRQPAYFSIGKDRSIEDLGVFNHFNFSRGRSIKFIDSNKDGQLDLFVTGFAPRKAKNLTTNQLYKNEKSQFVAPITLTIANDPLSVKTISTDINNDGNTDILTFGGRDMTLSVGQGDGTFVDATTDILGELAKIKFVNNITEIDYDNDGDFDLFLNRSAYQFEKEAYYDAENNNFAFFVFRNTFMFDEIEVEGENLVLENIQETYATYDIQLGEKRTVVGDKGGHHPGTNLTVKPEDAKGWPQNIDLKDMKGMHIGYLGDGKWRIGGYVKSRLAAVVKNVVSHPSEIKRKLMPAVLLENQGGRFVDVTAKMGIDIPEQTTSAAAGDFNNDGFVDLAVTPYGNMAKPVEHFVLINNQGQSFTKHSNAGLTSEEIGATGVGVSIIDYDQDGRLDLVYGNERGRWYLAQNQLPKTQLGNYVAVNVTTSPKHHAQPNGARVEVSACNTTWAQVVGSSGDGFHQMLNTRLHFGLGGCEKVDNIKVVWPNGESVTLNKVSIGSSVSTGN